MKFTDLNLDDRLMRAINDLGFTACTDVQAETFAHTLGGRDVAVQSQTGTGKTAAFLISIFQLWISDERFRGSKALVVAPTRELAVQIERDARAIGKYLPYRIAAFYGGVGYVAQEKAIAEGVDLIIGTPGRLLDFNESRKIDFKELGIMVIDEADRLFDMGFYPDIRKIMRRARPREERLTMLYSATLSVSVRNISWQFMNNPAEIEVTPEQVTVDKVDQALYHVSMDEKFSLLLGILRAEDPDNALIFCNTKRMTEIVAKKLQLNGYACEFIMGDLPQKKRIKIIDDLKSGKLRMLCATDVAARGLHVDDLDMVINYDLPEDPEAYVHRIGRTARAGKTGRAVSLACERFVYSLEQIQELIGMKIPVEPVTASMIAEDESRGRSLPLSHHVERPGRRRGGERRTAGRHDGDRNRAAREPSPVRKRPAGPKRAANDAGVREPAARLHTAEPRPHSRQQSRPHHDRPRPRGSQPTGGPERVASTGAAPRGASAQREGAETGPSRATSMQDRLAYYREKYGEEFVAARTEQKEKPQAAGTGSGGKPGPSASGERPKPTERSGGIRGALGRIFGGRGRS